MVNREGSVVEAVLGLDIGSNSVGSAWINLRTGEIRTGVSVFPAGVEESDETRGEPRNAKRRMTRRTRITLRRRAERKRKLRLKLIESGLLPASASEYRTLLEGTDPWKLRRDGLDRVLTPHEFGRVLLHLAQRRGALGLRPIQSGDDDDLDSEDGQVRRAIGEVRAKMVARRVRTFGEFVAQVRDERVHAITSEDRRRSDRRLGLREFRDPIRNQPGRYEHCADRPMIRDEFSALWSAQLRLGGGPRPSELARLLTPELRQSLDAPGDQVFQEGGLLFEQRRQTWDLGVLGRCDLEPSERCVPQADRHASRYLVVETVNNIKVTERGRKRALTVDERRRLIDYLSGPLGVHTTGRFKGTPKRHASVTDIRAVLGWGRATKTSVQRLSIESDPDRVINTDWFHREIVHGAVTLPIWSGWTERQREGLNRALLKFDPANESHEGKLREGLRKWLGLSEDQVSAAIAAWKKRPNPSEKRLRMSRRAVRNLMVFMDRDEPWPDPKDPGQHRWLTQIEARKLVAEDAGFRDVTTGAPLDERARWRYATGARGMSARDRHYLKKHGKAVLTLPPAPPLTNPVVRKAIHEVRRHVLSHMRVAGSRPAEVRIELAREAKMGAKESDRVLARNRLRERARRDIIQTFGLHAATPTQRRSAVDRVVLCVQQGSICPLCGQGGLTHKAAAEGSNCELAHILPRAAGGDSGYRNLVLAHTSCNRDMAKRTPRQYFERPGGPGVDVAKRWLEGIYGEVKRPKPSEIRAAEGAPLWACYFDRREDMAKLAQFAKDIKDLEPMTAAQGAATKYAARQVMAYLADALFEGKGLPERGQGGDQRMIYNSDGLWTSRFRREWGLYFDPHHARTKGLGIEEQDLRREKDRGDHRHHAIDAILVALCTRSHQIAWEERERAAEKEGINTADEEQMDRYRRDHPLQVPAPFHSRERFRAAVQRAVYGDLDSPGGERPVSHRATKRRLAGALHEETLMGPVPDALGQLSTLFTARKGVESLTPNHLRMPEGWDELEAQLHNRQRPTAEINTIRDRLAAMPDPPPAKSGIVRDRALRHRLRACLRLAGLDPDNFTKSQLARFLSSTKGFHHESGVPIRRIVLLRTINDPVVIPRRVPEHYHDRMVVEESLDSHRAYVGGNNHHIEIRASTKAGKQRWKGVIVSQYEAAQRNLVRLRTIKSQLPHLKSREDWKRLSDADRATLRSIDVAHPIVARHDDEVLGGRFVMSLSEGEMLYMKHKDTGELGYYVVAKLDPPSSVVLVPHWDARAATARKDADNNKVPHSEREQFSISPSDLAELAPPGKPHAQKVRVTPLGEVIPLDRD